MKKLIIAGLATAGLLTGGAIALQGVGGNVASAQSDAKSVVDAAKARGDVAERIDGYLVAAPSANAAVRAAVNEINIGRKSVYTQTARQNNTKVEVAAQLTGEKLIASTRPGEYFVGANGQWTQK